MDNKLFNKEDVLTNVTAEQAVLETPGYFGDSIRDLIKNVERDDVETLVDINADDGYCFGTRKDLRYYLFFLPKDKVKKSHTYTYRPLANLAELLVFLVPGLDISVVCDSAGNNAETSRYEKAKLLLGKQITIREKQSAYTTVLIIDRVDFYGDSDTCDAIHINGSQLNFLFECYEILIDGEWQPFGVKDYNEN